MAFIDSVEVPHRLAAILLHFSLRATTFSTAYSLARPASEIYIGEIVRQIDGPLAPISCASVTAYERCSCPDEEHCGLRLIMMDVRNAISNVLDRYTLAQLAEVTLQHLRRDGLVPKVVELVRHLDLSTRAKFAAKTPPPPIEPEFCI